MSGFKPQIQDQMKAAMKQGEALKVSTLRMLISEIKKKEIDKRSELDSEETYKLIRSMVKQRQDSVEAFSKGGRNDLADQEKSEIEILRTFLPAEVPKEQVESLVVETIQKVGASKPQDIGMVMKAVLAVAKEKGLSIDGKTVNEIARTKLQ